MSERQVRILDIIRAASGDLGTHEIGEALGPWRPFRLPKCGHEDCNRPEHGAAGYAWPYHPADQVRPHLVALEKKGLVQRVHRPKAAGANPMGQLYWRVPNAPPTKGQVEAMVAEIADLASGLRAW